MKPQYQFNLTNSTIKTVTKIFTQPNEFFVSQVLYLLFIYLTSVSSVNALPE